MLGIALATLVTTTPLPEGPPDPREPPPEFKAMVCENYPLQRTFPYISQGGYVMLDELTWTLLMQDYDFTVACLIFERERK